MVVVCEARCIYCGEVMRANSYDELKELVKEHLLTRHIDVLAGKLGELCRKRACPFSDEGKNLSWFAGMVASEIIDC